MKASRQDVSLSLPKVPIARLVGHEGPIQHVKFAGKLILFCIDIALCCASVAGPLDDTYLALGQNDNVLTTLELLYSFTLT
jgi:hypothetical protein